VLHLSSKLKLLNVYRDDVILQEDRPDESGCAPPPCEESPAPRRPSPQELSIIEGGRGGKTRRGEPLMTASRTRPSRVAGPVNSVSPEAS